MSLSAKENCIIFKAPPLDEITDKIYKHGNKCYTFKSTSTKCDASKTNVEIA